jgi:hypothetical protein
MKFMTIVKSAEKSPAGPPPPALFDAIDKLGQDAVKAGVFVEMGGLMPTAAGATLRLSGGRISVKDGPFTEAKEVIGGYAIYNTGTKQEAIDWAIRFLDLHKKHWPAWEGEVEVRQFMEGPPG